MGAGSWEEAVKIYQYPQFASARRHHSQCRQSFSNFLQGCSHQAIKTPSQLENITTEKEEEETMIQAYCEPRAAYGIPSRRYSSSNSRVHRFWILKQCLCMCCITKSEQSSIHSTSCLIACGLLFTMQCHYYSSHAVLGNRTRSKQHGLMCQQHMLPTLFSVVVHSCLVTKSAQRHAQICSYVFFFKRAMEFNWQIINIHTEQEFYENRIRF